MKLGSRHIWIALQLLAVAVFLFVSAKVTRELFYYVFYNRSTEAHLKDWRIVEVSPGQFKISVIYDFVVEDEVFRNQHLFAEPRFQNRYAAEETMRQLANRSWTAWFRMTSPLKSTLEHSFPLKGLVQLTLVFGVFFYFRFLKSYLAKRGVYNDIGPTKISRRTEKKMASPSSFEGESPPIL